MLLSVLRPTEGGITSSRQRASLPNEVGLTSLFSRERSEPLDTLFLDCFCMPGAAGTGLAEGETGLCEAKTGLR